MRSKPVEVRLDPEDNQRLARLCGSLDEDLRQIESALDVTIARRGSKFTVRGEQAQRAAQAIEHFYDRASGELTLDDVQRSEEHTSELQSPCNLVCRLLLEKKKTIESASLVDA